MSNTRILYSDLKLSFTLGTSTDPSISYVADKITDLYKDAYNILYGNQNYYDANDANISSKVYETFNNVIKRCSERIIEEITDSQQVGSTKERPKWEFSPDERNTILRCFVPTMRFSSHEDEDIDQVGDGV